MIICHPVCEPGQQPSEGWFASAQEFDNQAQQRLLRCPACNSDEVRRLPAASHIQASSTPRLERQEVQQRLLAELIGRVARRSQDVGRRFAEVARKMHYQEAPARSIRGAAAHGKMRELRDEGIPLLPAPGKSTDLH